MSPSGSDWLSPPNRWKLPLKLARLTPPRSTMRPIVGPRLAFTSSCTFQNTVDFHSVPASSAAPRCAASTLQEIDLKCLLADLPLQLRNPALRPALPPSPRKHVLRPLAELPARPIQHIRVHVQRPPRPRLSPPCSSRRTAASLNSFVNCLRENHYSILRLFGS